MTPANLKAAIDHLNAALDQMPYLEEIEQGTQDARDLAVVIERVKAARVRLAGVVRRAGA